MAARIILCIEGHGASQQPRQIRNLVEIGATSIRNKGVTFQATAAGVDGTFTLRCSDQQHLAVLREAVAEQARPSSAASFIVLMEDRGRDPVFHAEKVASPEIQASFDDGWAQLQAA